MDIVWKNTVKCMYNTCMCRLLAGSSLLYKWPITYECSTPSQTTNYPIFDTETVGLQSTESHPNMHRSELNILIDHEIREMTSEPVEVHPTSGPTPLPIFFSNPVSPHRYLHFVLLPSSVPMNNKLFSSLITDSAYLQLEWSHLRRLEYRRLD